MVSNSVQCQVVTEGRVCRQEQVRGVEWRALLPDLCDVVVERGGGADDVPAAGAGLPRRHLTLRSQDRARCLGSVHSLLGVSTLVAWG